MFASGMFSSRDARHLLRNHSLQLSHISFLTYPTPMWDQLFSSFETIFEIAISTLTNFWSTIFDPKNPRLGSALSCKRGLYVLLLSRKDRQALLKSIHTKVDKKWQSWKYQALFCFFKFPLRILTWPASGLSWTERQILLKTKSTFPLIVRWTETLQNY